MIESRRVTLECQTLKVRERVRRSFVIDLAGFRHLRIRQQGGFVTRATSELYSLWASLGHCFLATGQPYGQPRAFDLLCETMKIVR
jgi:hypothetical protein